MTYSLLMSILHIKGNVPEEKYFRVQNAPRGRNDELQEGEIKLETLYLSVDPYHRTRMNPDKSYVPPFNLGVALEGAGCGRVIESKNEEYQVGDVLTSMKVLKWPWQEIVIFDAERVKAEKLTKINNLDVELIPHTIGQLGMPGLTAYFGMIERGVPKEGETLVVSSGAGACGSIAGQIGKILGCHVVGITSSQEKIDYMIGLGFDVGINYSGKSEKELEEELRAACPRGVDIYYDNVGGWISNAVLRLMNVNGRVPICGQISQYNKEVSDPLPDELENDLKSKNVDRRWFMFFGFAAQFDDAWKQLFEWVKGGKIKVHYTMFEGIELMPSAFLALYESKNIGKLIVKIHKN